MLHLLTDAGSGWRGHATSPGAMDPTWTPPADTTRGATADLCDVFLPEPVDVTAERKVQIMQPLFRWDGRVGWRLKAM